MSERIKTPVAAKILGVSQATVVEYIRTGKYPIGEYSKNGGKATVCIYASLLAAYLKTDISYIRERVLELEEQLYDKKKGA